MTTERAGETAGTLKAGKEGAPEPAEQGPDAIQCRASDRRLSTERWLLSAHPAPGRARTEWQEHGLTLLPLGALFSAVRLPGRLVSALAGTAEPEDLDVFLDEALSGGPVICDTRGPRYYALVPGRVPWAWRTAVEDWRTQGVDCLGRGAYLGVPRLDLVDIRARGAASYWSVPLRPSAPFVLCPPLSVARLVAAAARCLAGEPQ